MIGHTTLDSPRKNSTDRSSSSSTPPPSPTSPAGVARSFSNSSTESDGSSSSSLDGDEAIEAMDFGPKKENYRNDYRKVPVHQCPSFVSENDGQTYFIYVDPIAFKQVQHTAEFENAVNKAVQGRCFSETGIKRFGGYDDRVFEARPSGRINERVLGFCIKDFNGGDLVVLNQYASKHEQNNDALRRELENKSRSYDLSPDTTLKNFTATPHQTRQRK